MRVRVCVWWGAGNNIFTHRAIFTYLITKEEKTESKKILLLSYRMSDHVTTLTDPYYLLYMLPAESISDNRSDSTF